MNVPIEFIALFLTVVLGAMGALIKYLVGAISEMRHSLKEITDHLGDLNSRVGRSETWQEQHERQDDERQEATEREHQRIWMKLDQRRA